MNGENSDGLSNLPDCVLIDILSRLDTTEVVQTCILSKRWLKLWTFVPRLYFNSGEFKAKNTSENEERSIESLENFVTTFLRLRDDATNLDSFTLLTPLRDDDNYEKLPGCVIRRWILYASTHNPKELRINLHANSLIHLPDCLFTCESLEYIHLQMEDIKEEIKPKTVCLPKLKILFLSNASLDGDCMKKLLLGCPALESLTLYECALDMDSISFHNLKNLSFGCCSIVGEVLCTISAPGLEYLQFIGDIGTKFKLVDMSTVTEAEISTTYQRTGVLGYSLDLLNSLSGVETMEIDSLHFRATLQGELPRCPTFYKLKNLTLGDGCMYCNFDLLYSFLRHCPNLVVLTLSHHEYYCEDERIPDEEDQSFESFGCKHLKKINVHHSSVDCKVNRLVGLLLQCTKEIHKVQIILSKIPIELA